MMFKEKIKESIELYTGAKVTSIEVVKDPRITDSYAIQTKHLENAKERVCQWLLVHVDSTLSSSNLCNLLEEVEFTSWPPTSGNLKFF